MPSSVLVDPSCAPDASAGPGDVRTTSGDCAVVMLTSERRGDWERYVANQREGTVFHTLGWHDAVAWSFPHEDVYLIAYRGGRVVGVLPMFLVASRLAGRMLVSLPYAVGGGILADDDTLAVMLFEYASDLAVKRRCATIDLRSERPALRDLPVVDRYVGFERVLPSKPEDVPRWLPRKARAAGRNAREKHGLTVSFGDEFLREVWRLYSVSMRRLASLAYPFAFFDELAGRLPHWTCVVQRQGRTVAGLLTLLHGDRVLPYFVGSTDEARECSAANFIYLSTMERGVAEGFRIYDFGRSRRDNPGSYDFKRFHGFEPRPLGYQRFQVNGAGARDLTPSNPVFAWSRRLWPMLPLGITQRLGAHLVNHIPG